MNKQILPQIDLSYYNSAGELCNVPFNENDWIINDSKWIFGFIFYLNL